MVSTTERPSGKNFTSRTCEIKTFSFVANEKKINLLINLNAPGTDLQHAAVVGEAFEVVCDAHAELLGARLHGAPDHEAVARLEHVQGARDGGEGHSAHEDGHFLVQAVEEAAVCWDIFAY